MLAFKGYVSRPGLLEISSAAGAPARGNNKLKQRVLIEFVSFWLLWAGPLQPPNKPDGYGTADSKVFCRFSPPNRRAFSSFEGRIDSAHLIESQTVIVDSARRLDRARKRDARPLGALVSVFLSSTSVNASAHFSIFTC